MSKIRSFSLPPVLVAALVEAVKEIPEEIIDEWGRDCLPGGFTRRETIIERLCARIRGEGSLDARVTAMFADHMGFRDTIRALSLEALKFLERPLSAYVGREDFLLQLLLDEREPVHQWAIELCGKPDGLSPSQDDGEESLDTLHLFIEDNFVFPLEYGAMPPAPPTEEDRNFVRELSELHAKELTEKVETHRKTIEHLNNELQLQKQRHLAKQKEAAEAAQREAKAASTEAIQLRNQLGKARQEKEAQEKKSQELNSRIDVAVSEKVQALTSSIVRKWLKAPMQAEAALADLQPKAVDLLARAEQALEAQARLDLHSANRLELERKLQALLQARDRLRAALETALNPVPEIKPLLEDMEAELARLEKVLSGTRASPGIASELVARINSAADWEDARICGNLVESLADAGLLPSSGARAVYDALQRKFSLLEETSRQKPTEPDTGWSLRDTIYRNRSALLIIDGHNLLYNLPDLFATYYEGNGHPGLKARQRLAAMVAKLLADRGNLKAKICFDGPDARVQQVSPNVAIEYSGGTGRDRADELIIQKLQFKDLQHLDQRVFVITDDRRIRHEVLRTGSKFVRNDLFAVLLADFQCLQQP